MNPTCILKFIDINEYHHTYTILKQITNIVYFISNKRDIKTVTNQINQISQSVKCRIALYVAYFNAYVILHSDVHIKYEKWKIYREIFLIV